MRIYIIGPVTGREDRNRAAFEAARRTLEAAGHEVSTPLDFVPEDATHAMAMRMSLCWMLHTGNVDAVYALAGWEDSPGATVERMVAMACGIPCAEHYVTVSLGSLDAALDVDRRRMPKAESRARSRKGSTLMDLARVNADVYLRERVANWMGHVIDSKTSDCERELIAVTLGTSRRTLMAVANSIIRKGA